MPKLTLTTVPPAITIIANEPTLLQCAAYVERSYADAIRMTDGAIFRLSFEIGFHRWFTATMPGRMSRSTFERRVKATPQYNYNLTYEP